MGEPDTIPTNRSSMKTSLLFLLTSMLAAASAAPLPPMVSAAIGGGVSAANQLRMNSVPSLAVSPIVPRAALAVPAAPTPVFIAPAPARAVRTR